MANNFKFTGVDLTTTNETTVVTASGSSILLIGSIIICNTTAGTDSTLDLTVYDSSEDTAYTMLATESIKRGVSHEILSRPLVLENGDELRVQAAAADVYHVLVSYMARDRERN